MYNQGMRIFVFERKIPQTILSLINQSHKDRSHRSEVVASQVQNNDEGLPQGLAPYVI